MMLYNIIWLARPVQPVDIKTHVRFRMSAAVKMSKGKRTGYRPWHKANSLLFTDPRWNSISIVLALWKILLWTTCSTIMYVAMSRTYIDSARWTASGVCTELILHVWCCATGCLLLILYWLILGLASPVVQVLIHLKGCTWAFCLRLQSSRGYEKYQRHHPQLVSIKYKLAHSHLLRRYVM